MDTISKDQVNRTVIVPYPNIYHSFGTKLYPLRCPVCKSADYSGGHCFFDEQYTFALNPLTWDPNLPAGLRYQRYVILYCNKCHYCYHVRPEGLWYEEKHPYMFTSVFLLSSDDPDITDIEIPEPPEIEPDTDEQHSLFVGTYTDEKSEAKMQRYVEKGLPIYQLPAPHFIAHIKKQKPNLMISRYQDLQIIKLARRRRYSDTDLNPAIVNSQIMLLTGAGFSFSLNFPTMADFKNKLPEWVINILDEWMSHKQQLMHNAWNDFEVLLDILLHIQRIGIVCDDENHFLEQLKHFEHSSIFVFNERSDKIEENKNDWICYPPLNHLRVHEQYKANLKTPHFQKIRKIFHAVIKTMILACHEIDSKDLEQAKDTYHPFLSKLAELNGSPLPIYTTNFDQVVENVFSETGELDKLVSGIETGHLNLKEFSNLKSGDESNGNSFNFSIKPISNQPFKEISGKSIALFHLHGGSNWFINKNTHRAIAAAGNREQLEQVFDKLWYSSEPWLPGCIVPASVKDAYTIAPPFNTGYDYLAENIKKTRILLIIGQSLRDETLKEMILWSSKANPGLKYIVAGKEEKNEIKRDDPDLYHILDCIPRERLLYVGGGFPSNADQLLAFCEKFLQHQDDVAIPSPISNWKQFEEAVDEKKETGENWKITQEKASRLIDANMTNYEKWLLKQLFLFPGIRMKGVELIELLQIPDHKKHYFFKVVYIAVISGGIHFIPPHTLEIRLTIPSSLKRYFIPSFKESKKVFSALIERLHSHVNSVNSQQPSKWMKYAKSLVQIITEKNRATFLLKNNLSAAYRWSGNYKEAKEIGMSALQDATASGEIKQSTIAHLHSNVGLSCWKLEAFQEAVGYLETALKLNIDLYGENHKEVGVSYYDLGLVYQDMKNDEKAVKCFEKALELYNCFQGEFQMYTDAVDIMKRLAELYYSTGRK